MRPVQVVHDILDFMVGDRIKVDKYEIFEDVMDTLEDRFEDIYGDEVAEEDLPIRIRHEQTDNIRQTLIDVDFDQDDVYEMTINISGDHVLLVVDNGPITGLNAAGPLREPCEDGQRPQRNAHSSTGAMTAAISASAGASSPAAHSASCSSPAPAAGRRRRSSPAR